MAKIAAIIAPFRGHAALPALRARLDRALALYPHARVESQTYTCAHAFCVLSRVVPDPLNPRPQPFCHNALAGVVCGYYHGPTPAAGDGAARLLTDVERDGVAALARGDGVFAFAYWDAARGCMTAGVDKLGMRPLYWAVLPGGGYVVASEIKTIAVLLDELKINWAAWEEQLTFGFMFGEHTLFEGIQRFAPAECISFWRDRHAGQIVEHFLESIEIAERPVEAFLEEQGAIFDATMARLAGLYNAPRDSLLTLSGGYDSRRALGWLLNHDIRPGVYTVPEVRRDGSEYESAIVAQLCRETGIDGYTIYPPTVADRVEVGAMRDLASDFESDEHNFSTILAMGLACHDKVNYDGLGAGSQLMGAFVAPHYFAPGGDARFLAGLARSARGWLAMPAADAPPLAARVRAQLTRWADNPNRFAYFYLLSRTRREIALAPLSIQANVFESLCPYLDRAMMRSALSFPPARKIGADIQMRSIAALHPRLGRLPTVYTRGIDKDPRYRRDYGRVDRGAARTWLKQASRRRGKACSLAAGQRLRLRSARLLAVFGDSPRLGWQIDKAAKMGQLAHFETVSASPADYAVAVDALKSAFGQRTGWQQALAKNP